MAEKNSTILKHLWLNGSTDYQQRVPNPTQSDISATMQALFSPMNGKLYNEFMTNFVNLIGMQVVHDKVWQSPLAPFKTANNMYGSTIQETALNWVEAHAYKDDLTDLLAYERPTGETVYHTLNRQDKYKISITRQEAELAFRDAYGLNRLIDAVLNVPINSDNYDEYRIMLSLIAQYEDSWGFFKYQLSAAPTDEETGKEFLTALRTVAGRMAFPSALYNAANVNVPVFARPQELVLFVTPETNASVEVNTLSSVFQLDQARIQYRIVVVDELPIPDAVALLTTDGFYIANDQLYETTSFYDPNTLTTHNWLHHWQTLSVSPFVPACIFTTKTGTVVPVATVTPASLTVTAPENVEVGGTAQLTTVLNGTITTSPANVDTEGISVAPDAVTWELSATRTTGSGDNEVTESVALNTRTYVDRFNVLHVQKSVLKAGDVIQLVATSTYINPSGATTPIMATKTITVA